MPEYRINVTSSDGASGGPDLEGITLHGVGAARALVIETRVETARLKTLRGLTPYEFVC